MSNTRRYLFLFFVLLFALGCSTVSNSFGGPTPTPLARGNKDLVSYISDKDGSKEIYILSLDRQYTRRLTDNDLEEMEIFWAPNAQSLLFTACQDKICDIYSISADGHNLKRLTDAKDGKSSYSEPAWSPDGRSIAFVLTSDGEKQIYIMNANGSRLRRLTRSGTYNVSPAWSPDGTRLAYSSNEFGDYDILTIDPDGREKTRVTDNDYDDLFPVWSPDSNKIAFLSAPDRDKGNVLFLINADGTNVQDISAGVTEIRDDVVWSPTSSAIAFSAFPSRTTHQIYGVMADHWGGTQYSVNELNNFGPSWAPDGERLVYYVLSKDYKSSEVYVNAGGTRNSHQLTFDKANVSYVAWVPIETQSADRYVFPTFTPEPTQVAKEIYFIDDFSDSSRGWYVGDSKTGKATFKLSDAGTYQITIKTTDTTTSSLINYRYRNVRIELDAAFDSNVDNSSVGVVCRAKDYDNYYLMRIAYRNGKGYFRVLMQKDNEWHTLTESSEYYDIRRGSNHLSVSCIDNALKMSVNGQELATVYDSTFTEGKVGVHGGAWEDVPVTVTFDTFEVIPIP